MIEVINSNVEDVIPSKGLSAYFTIGPRRLNAQQRRVPVLLRHQRPHRAELPRQPVPG